MKQRFIKYVTAFYLWSKVKAAGQFVTNYITNILAPACFWEHVAKSNGHCQEFLPSHSSVADTAGCCSGIELGQASAKSDCSLWSHSAESQTPATALHRWQKKYKYHKKKIMSIYTFLPLPLLLLPSWLVVMLTLSLAGSLPLRWDTPLSAWIVKVYVVWGSRPHTSTLRPSNPCCAGR